MLTLNYFSNNSFSNSKTVSYVICCDYVFPIVSHYFHVLVRLPEMYLSVSLQSVDVNIIEVQNIFE